MSHDQSSGLAPRRLWTRILWTMLLFAGAVDLAVFHPLPKQNTLALFLVLVTTLGLWLGPWMEGWTQKVSARLLHWWHPNGSGKEESPQKLARISAALVEGLQFSFILTLIALGLLHFRLPHGSVVGEHLEQVGYGLLREMLSGSDTDDPPVIVIDTSAVPRVDLPGSTKADLVAADAALVGLAHSPAAPGNILAVPALVHDWAGFAREPVTDRAPLKRFLEMLALPENEDSLPLAVGIDINFHNGNGGFLHPNDYQFFEYCLHLGLKIYLGVYGVESLPPEQWLAVKDYAHLAASIAVPREDQGHLYASTPGSHGPPALGVALARCCQDHWHAPPPLCTIFTKDEISVRDRPALSTETFLVDYSWLPALQGQAKQNRPLDAFRNPNDVRVLKGKLVLLGDVRGATIRDAFVVPGEAGPVPGVYLHGCAAATLAQSPLFELKPYVRDSADLVLALGVLVWLMALRLRASQSGLSLAETALPPAFGIVALVVGISSLVLVQFRIFWPDALVVALLLALHPVAEWAWHTLSHALRPLAEWAWHTLSHAPFLRGRTKANL